MVRECRSLHQFAIDVGIDSYGQLDISKVYNCENRVHHAHLLLLATVEVELPRTKQLNSYPEEKPTSQHYKTISYSG